MGTIYNCDQSELIDRTSEELKKVETVKPPTWSAVVKTGMHKERPPIKNDWWYTRTASVLSQVYRHGPIGVSKLRNKYGGKKNRGVRPGHFYKGSGNILRKIFQQLESAGFVKKEEKEVHKGRVITAQGKKFLDEMASKISTIEIQKKDEKKIKHEGKKPKPDTESRGAKIEKKGAKQEPKPVPKEQKTEIKLESKPRKPEDAKKVEMGEQNQAVEKKVQKSEVAKNG